MTIKEYQENAVNTLAVLEDKTKDLTHMLCGTATEVGEFLDVFKKWFAYGKEFDRINAREELGDICWYLANTATIIKYELDQSCITQKEEKELDIDTAFQRSLGMLDHTVMIFNLSPAGTKIEYFFWRLTEIATLLGFSMSDILSRNIEKLKQRYPNKFTQEDALNRDLDKELEILTKEVV